MKSLKPLDLSNNHTTSTYCIVVCLVVVMILGCNHHGILACSAGGNEVWLIKSSLSFANVEQKVKFGLEFKPILIQWNDRILALASSQNIILIDTSSKRIFKDILLPSPSQVCAIGEIQGGCLPGCENFLVLFNALDRLSLSFLFQTHCRNNYRHQIKPIQGWEGMLIPGATIDFAGFVSIHGQCILLVQSSSSTECMVISIDVTGLTPVIVNTHTIEMPPGFIIKNVQCSDDGNILVLLISSDKSSVRLCRLVTLTMSLGEICHFTPPSKAISNSCLASTKGCVAVIVDHDKNFWQLDEEGAVSNFIPWENATDLAIIPTGAGAGNPIACANYELYFMLDGLIRSCPLPVPGRGLLKELSWKINEGLPYENIFSLLTSSSIDEIISFSTWLSPATRKTQFFEVLGKLVGFLQLNEEEILSGTVKDYQYLLQGLARLNYFHEVLVACTNNLNETIKKFLDSASSEKKIDIIPETLICLPSLCEQTMEILLCFFAVREGLFRQILNRALQVSFIHHRMVSVVQLLLIVRDHVDVLVERFESLNVVPLSTFYHSFLEVFDDASSIDLSLLQESLRSYPVSAPNVGIEFIFYGSQVDDQLLYKEEKATTLMVDQKSVLRDAFFGLKVDERHCKAWCSFCGLPFPSEELVKSSFMEVPFWYYAFTSQCSCGHELIN